jgi:hypothetical protein
MCQFFHLTEILLRVTTNHLSHASAIASVVRSMQPRSSLVGLVREFIGPLIVDVTKMQLLVEAVRVQCCNAVFCDNCMNFRVSFRSLRVIFHFHLSGVRGKTTFSALRKAKC